MVVFGLVLLVLALGVIAYMWFATRGMDAAQLSYGFLNLEVTPFWMFLAGGITLGVATCALWLIAVGTRSRARKAKEVRELRRQAGEQSQTSTAGRGEAPGQQTNSAGTRGSVASPAGAGQTGSILPRPGRGATGDGGTGPGSAPSSAPRAGDGATRPNSLDVDR